MEKVQRLGYTTVLGYEIPRKRGFLKCSTLQANQQPQGVLQLLR